MSLKSRALLLLLIVLTFASHKSTAQTDRRIDAIKTICQKIDEDVARSEQEPEHSNIYLTELAVNKGNGSYPAVGIYRPLVKFFYTYGDREKDPYPNRLIKIVVTVERSDRKEYSEYCFNESRQLISHFSKKDDVELQLYFASDRAIAFQQDKRPMNLRTRSSAAIVTSVLKEKVNLVGIFKRSLGF